MPRTSPGATGSKPHVLHYPSRETTHSHRMNHTRNSYRPPTNISPTTQRIQAGSRPHVLHLVIQLLVRHEQAPSRNMARIQISSVPHQDQIQHSALTSHHSRSHRPQTPRPIRLERNAIQPNQPGTISRTRSAYSSSFDTNKPAENSAPCTSPGATGS